MTFATWKEARDHAEAQARRLHIAQGIEYNKFDKRWIVRMLPKPENRYGYDAACEAIEWEHYTS